MQPFFFYLSKAPANRPWKYGLNYYDTHGIWHLSLGHKPLYMPDARSESSQVSTWRAPFGLSPADTPESPPWLDTWQEPSGLLPVSTTPTLVYTTPPGPSQWSPVQPLLLKTPGPHLVPVSPSDSTGVTAPWPSLFPQWNMQFLNLTRATGFLPLDCSWPLLSFLQSDLTWPLEWQLKHSTFLPTGYYSLTARSDLGLRSTTPSTVSRLGLPQGLPGYPPVHQLDYAPDPLFLCDHISLAQFSNPLLIQVCSDFRENMVFKLLQQNDFF